MPIYEYVCENCGKLNEVIHKVSDPAPEKCEGCGDSGKLQKVISRNSFVLKGGGWYSDLYSSSKKGGGGSGGSSSSSSSGGNSGSSGGGGSGSSASST